MSPVQFDSFGEPILPASDKEPTTVSRVALRSGVVPPIRNLDDPDDEADVDAVRTVPRQHPHDVALSTSFGFGGHDVSLVLTK